MPGGIEPSLAVILSWPKPDTSPQSRGFTLLVLVILLGLLSIIAVVARFYARLYVTRSFGIDDWVLLAAMIPTIGFAISIATSVQVFGFRRHVWDLVDLSDTSVLLQVRKVTFANEILYIVASVLIKLSILLFYLRLAEGSTRRTFVAAVWIVAASVVAYLVASIAALFATCHPFPGFWLRILPWWRASHSHSCVNEGVAVIAFSVISAAQDCIIALLPVLLVARLPVAHGKKFVLGLIFGLGFFLCVAAIVRIVYLKQVFYDSWDATWVMYNVWLWMIVEVLLAPVCASAPAFRPLFLQCLLPRLRITSNMTRTSSFSAAPTHSVSVSRVNSAGRPSRNNGTLIRENKTGDRRGLAALTKLGLSYSAPKPPSKTLAKYTSHGSAV